MRTSLQLAYRWTGATAPLSATSLYAPFVRRLYSSDVGKKRGGSKVYASADEAVADLRDGSTILSAGFGLCGVAGKKPPFFYSAPRGWVIPCGFSTEYAPVLSRTRLPS